MIRKGCLQQENNGNERVVYNMKNNYVFNQIYYLSNLTSKKLNQIKISCQYAIISYLFAASAAYGAALKIWKYICCLF